MTQFHLNVLASSLDNAKRIMEVSQGKVFVGVIVKDYPSVDIATETVWRYQREGVKVSIGLGSGDSTAWEKVFEVAVATGPAHVNQVFPATGYTLGGLRAKGYSDTIVNALIRPSGIPGKVILFTGPQSEYYSETVSCDAAAAFLADIGAPSVKFFPIEGASRLDEVAAMVKAAVHHGISTFEPTGGIDLSSFDAVVETCVANGVEHVIPHVYSSIIDRATGDTRIEDVTELVRRLS
jgi:2-dehydro-3-deoxy-phosphogluconate aldolase